MSLITEQIKALKNHADYMQEIGHLFTASIIRHAADTIEQLAAKVRTENAIPIPKGATNGDILKRLFYGKAIITEFIHDVNISVNNKVIGQFDMEWWRSPYKRGETE